MEEKKIQEFDELDNLIFGEPVQRSVEEKIEFELQEKLQYLKEREELLEEHMKNFENKISLEDPHTFICTVQNALSEIQAEYSDLCKLRIKIDVLKRLKNYK